MAPRYRPGLGLLRPAVVEDDFDEIVADERRIEMREDVGVDVAERAAGSVPVTVGERLKYAAFEIGPGMGGGPPFTRAAFTFPGAGHAIHRL